MSEDEVEKFKSLLMDWKMLMERNDEERSHRDEMRVKWLEIGRVLGVPPAMPFEGETVRQNWARFAELIIARAREIIAA